MAAGMRYFFLQLFFICFCPCKITVQRYMNCVILQNFFSVCFIILNFSIRYRTPFGQSMHVCVSYIDTAGHTRMNNLLMRTDDGDIWTAETTGIVFAHIPIRFLTYTYQVEDDEGKVMRKEWDAVPRLFCLDVSRKYIFHDIWRDLSLQHYIYPLSSEREVQPVSSMPCFNRSVIFRVSAPQVGDGFSVAVLGSEPSLGVWNEMRYLPMRYIGDGDWMLTINAYAMTLPFEFKYVVVNDTTHDVVEWESGENRKAEVIRLEDGEQLVVYGGNLRTQCELVYRDEMLKRESKLKHEIRELYI